MTTQTTPTLNTGIDITLNKILIYSFIVDFMKQGCSHQTCQKLDLLKREIEKGYNSPSTASLNILNLFIFGYKDYVEMYKSVQGELQ
jgi:hypothetical protein